MSESSTLAPDSGEATSDARSGVASWFYPLLLRLHFYVGLLVGPFILVAALSGGLYAISPQIENAIYADALNGSASGTPHSLAEQIAVARREVPADLTLAAVRPAPEPGLTTRVMFNDPSLGQYQHRAIFVDPVTLEPTGDLAVYGTSGALPLRIWIDFLHRNLLLGETGRIYSELAASWLWIAALGGLTLWCIGRRKRRRSPGLKAQDATPNGRRRSRHAALGLTLLLGFLFLSVTGLTWSRWAGGNIADMRAAFGWGTPGVSTQIAAPDGVEPGQQPSADALYDEVLASARAAGIDAGKLEIRPGNAPDRAWKVREIDRTWPTQVDSVAVDPYSLEVVDQANFEDFPIAAKLTRWGIDIHMGTLFGVANQVLMFALALGLCTMILWGYRMWWVRRPLPGNHRAAQARRLTTHWLRAPLPARLLILAVTVALGWVLPVMGVSLALFLVLDALIMTRHARSA
ncbi:PepSY-associated TM helix domain-containing protein [Marinobacter sp. JSM 1782161]|uniref:PepSY-associated TM helix domain-containing protein n=1 Tax=Marinobacter sp. JSM 1782161 TaxID=2685906 RepID=UPI0014038CF7|nr:PepSY-associated TM helix domain-containing protein [Marinobacter sp. JSM 1782161]